MTTPFGFGPGSGSDSGRGDGDGSFGGGPFSGFGGGPGGGFGGMGGGGMGGGDGAPFFRELEKLLSWQGGPVNWDLAGQLAHRAVADNDPAVSAVDSVDVNEALRLADTWLDAATALPSGVTRTEAWTRSNWLDRTAAAWREVCDPVAGRVGEAMTASMTSGLEAIAGGDTPPELAGMLPPGMDLAALAGAGGPMAGMMAQFGGLMFGAQVGQALGALAAEVASVTDIGLPLGPTGVAALLPAGVAAFGAGLEQPLDQVRLYLAMREAAHHRLFAHVPWLRNHLVGLITDFARGITIDPEAISQAMGALGTIDTSDPEALQQAMGAGVFSPEVTPAQQAALTRLETALALVEGWVDEVVAAAAADRLPAAVALREALRRRRATGGPAEQTFAALVGLQLRPRRLREAASLWAALRESRGIDGRDMIWSTPDLLPSAADLDDPSGFLGETSSSADGSGATAAAGAGAGAPAGERGTAGTGGSGFNTRDLDDPIAAIEALGDSGPREDAAGGIEPAQESGGPGGAGPDANGPDENGPDESGPDSAGPDNAGPDREDPPAEPV